MENKEKYIRVGTTLYKIVRRPLISGDYIEEKILWSYEALRQDYGKNNLPEIEKYVFKPIRTCQSYALRG